MSEHIWKNPGSEKKQISEDNLNARLGVLTRREVEARILAPVIAGLGEAFGRDEVLGVVRDTIINIARQQGALLGQQMGGNSLKHFADSLQFWTKDNALEMDVIEQSEKVLSFNVTRCRYAELYESLGIRAMGAIFSCTRDFALVEGFNPDISLRRTQTIMEGADYCDFRYRHKK
ncbi:MAG: L-2-amino-thiazoline-4-carboxylic acid hydrolase [Desulfobacterales bacterium]